MVKVSQLGDFVFVVRELKIAAAAMNVERLAQAAGGHHRAFDVPARTPSAPGGFPARLAGLGAFPQHEVQRVLLGFVDFDAGADAQVFDFLARQLAVAYELGDVYYRVAKFMGYGKLSRKKIEDLRIGARIEVDEAKQDPLDFVLWKATKPGEPSWESPWGAALHHRRY